MNNTLNFRRAKLKAFAFAFVFDHCKWIRNWKCFPLNAQCNAILEQFTLDKVNIKANFSARSHWEQAVCHTWIDNWNYWNPFVSLSLSRKGPLGTVHTKGLQLRKEHYKQMGGQEIKCSIHIDWRQMFALLITQCKWTLTFNVPFRPTDCGPRGLRISCRQC